MRVASLIMAISMGIVLVSTGPASAQPAEAPVYFLTAATAWSASEPRPLDLAPSSRHNAHARSFYLQGEPDDRRPDPGRRRMARVAGGGTIAVINPSDGAPFAELARGTRRGRRCRGQGGARGAGRRVGPDAGVRARPASSRRLGQLVLDRVEELAELEAQRCRQAAAPGQGRCAGAGPLLRVLRRRRRQGARRDHPLPAGYTVLTLREPHGVTGHIIPWNYPMQILGRSVGAALAMGNACVLKPGEDASLTALEVGQLALEAGLPPGVLNIVTGLRRGGGRRARRASRHRPRLVHRLARGRPPGAAGRRATHGCPVTLELGGKSPQIVFADADLDAGAAVRRQRRDPERRPDLLGRLAPAGRGPDLRRLRRRGRRALPHARRRPGRAPTSIAAR